MEYYYYNTTTGEFLCSKNRELETDEGVAWTNIAPPVCDHGDAYPGYIEKAVFDANTNTWTKQQIGE